MAKHHEVILLMNCPLFIGENLRSWNSQDLCHLVPRCLFSFTYTRYFRWATPAEAPPLLTFLCWSFSPECLSQCVWVSASHTSTAVYKSTVGTKGCRDSRGGPSRRQPILVSRDCSLDFFSPREVYFPGPVSSCRFCSLCRRLVPASLLRLHANFKTPFFKASFSPFFPLTLRQVPD